MKIEFQISSKKNENLFFSDLRATALIVSDSETPNRVLTSEIVFLPGVEISFFSENFAELFLFLI